MVAAYVHNAASPELGNIGVLVGLKSTADKDKLSALAKQLAMHVAAAAPLALTKEHLDKAVVEREYNVQKDIALQSGKPEAVVEKMMEGRMRKYYEEVVLLQQVYMLDGETPIAKLIEKASKDLGAPVEIEGFVRFKVGEGIEKAEPPTSPTKSPRWRAPANRKVPCHAHRAEIPPGSAQGLRRGVDGRWRLRHRCRHHRPHRRRREGSP